MNRSFQPLIDAEDRTAFVDALRRLKEEREGSVKELAESLGIAVSQLDYTLKAGKLPFRCCQAMAARLAGRNASLHQTLLKKICEHFDYQIFLPPSESPSASVSVMSPKPLPMIKSNGSSRPTFQAHSIIDYREQYTLQMEHDDVESILEARKWKGRGLKQAMHKLWFLVQTGTASEIGFTREEAISLEAKYRLTKLKAARSLPELNWALASLGIEFFPKNFISILEHGDAKDGYHTRVNGCIIESWKYEEAPDEDEVTLAEKLAALELSGHNRFSLFHTQVQCIAESLVGDIQRGHTEEGQVARLSKLEACIPFLKGGWSSLDVTYQQVRVWVSESMRIPAKKQYAELHAASVSGKDILESMNTFAAIIAEWGLSLEEVDTTPQALADMMVRQSFEHARRTHPSLFHLPGVLNAYAAKL